MGSLTIYWITNKNDPGTKQVIEENTARSNLAVKRTDFS